VIDFFQQQIMKYALVYFAAPSLPLLLESSPERSKPSDGGDGPTQSPPRDDEGIEEDLSEDEDLDDENIDFTEEEDLEVEEWDLSEEEDFEDLDWNVIEKAFEEDALPGEGGIDDIP
jgi:hypothetical protein